MEFNDVMTGRRSVRRYRQDKVTEEQVDRIVSRARYAPSWKNTQTVRYTAVMDPDLKKEIAETGVFGFKKNNGIINSAAVVMVVSTVRGISGYDKDGSASTTKGGHWESFDAGIASYAFCLAAKEEGLGTCIMGLFDEKTISSLIGLPENESISALIALGVPDEDPDMPKRKETGEILRIK